MTPALTIAADRRLGSRRPAAAIVLVVVAIPKGIGHDGRRPAARPGAGPLVGVGGTRLGMVSRVVVIVVVIAGFVPLWAAMAVTNSAAAESGRMVASPASSVAVAVVVIVVEGVFVRRPCRGRSGFATERVGGDLGQVVRVVIKGCRSAATRGLWGCDRHGW